MAEVPTWYPESTRHIITCSHAKMFCVVYSPATQLFPFISTSLGEYNHLPTQAESLPHSAKYAFKTIWHLTGERSISVLFFQLLAQESIIIGLFTETQRLESSSALTFCIQPDAPGLSEHEHLHLPQLTAVRVWAFPTSQEPQLPPTL